jgi:hypothetical protein
MAARVFALKLLKKTMQSSTIVAVAMLLGLGACSSQNTAPQAAPTGQRTLLTPASGELRYYSSASMSGPDQPAWVAINYDGQPSGILLAHLDTAGHSLGSRFLSYGAWSGETLGVAALTDGSCIALGGNNGNPILLKLAADGTTIWAKTLATSTGTPGGIVPLGAEALYYSAAGNANQRYFTRVLADGTVQPAVGYTFPSKRAPMFTQSPAFRALPAGGGAVLLEQLDYTLFQLTSIDENGRLRWVRQLDLTGLVGLGAQTSTYFDVAVSPGSGNLAVLISAFNAGQARLLRLSPAGALLGASTCTFSGAPSYLYLGHLVMGPLDEVAWLVESDSWLAYYAVDGQNSVLAATKIAGPQTSASISLGAYGLLSMGSKGAYGFGNFAGPEPNRYANTSINYLRISRSGQAGCPVADAPALRTAAVTNSPLVSVPLPAATTLANTTGSYSLYNIPLTLTGSSACL